MLESCPQVASIGDKTQSIVEERELALNKVQCDCEVQHKAECEIADHGHPGQDSRVTECHHRHQISVDLHSCVKNGLESVGSMSQIGYCQGVKSLSVRVCLLIEYILNDLYDVRKFTCLVEPLLYFFRQVHIHLLFKQVHRRSQVLPKVFLNLRKVHLGQQ
jgi:hypothetical protein